MASTTEIYLFLVLESMKSKMKILVDLVTGEDSVPGMHMAPYLLCPFMMKRVIYVILFKDANPVGSAPHPYMCLCLCSVVSDSLQPHGL